MCWGMGSDGGGCEFWKSGKIILHVQRKISKYVRMRMHGHRMLREATEHDGLCTLYSLRCLFNCETRHLHMFRMGGYICRNAIGMRCGVHDNNLLPMLLTRCRAASPHRRRLASLLSLPFSQPKHDVDLHIYGYLIPILHRSPHTRPT